MRKDGGVTERPLRRQPADESSPAGAGPDEAMMRALYHEHAGPLLGYVMKLVAGDRHRAEDVVQETLVRAWRNADRLEHGTGSLRPWLITVARRIVIDDHRSRQARPPEVDDSPLEFMPAAEDEMDRALRMMTITDAMDALTPAHREILVATYLKGRTVDQAAQELGLPPGTVRSRIFYALRSLKLALQERGVTS